MNVSFEAGMAILEALADSNYHKTIDQLDSHTNFERKKLYETLRVLEESRYISISHNSKIVTLSPKLWSLGFCWKAKADLKRVADYHLSDLVMSTGESACLAIIADREIVIAAGLNVPEPAGAEFEVGTKLPAVACAGGKAILAFHPLEMTGKLEKCTLATISSQHDLGALQRELEEIRLQGYAAHWNEFDGMKCEIAAPIRCVGGVTEAAVCISGSSSRLTREAIPAMAERVLATAERISRDLKLPRTEAAYEI